MDRTGSKFMESGEMELGAVALVLAETIFGKLCAKVTHDSVARDLGNYASRGDAQTVAIAVDDCSLRKRKWKHWKPVDQDVLRRNRKRCKSYPHRFMRSAQNVDSI